MQDQELGTRDSAAASDPPEGPAHPPEMRFQDFRELSGGMPRLERARAGAGPLGGARPVTPGPGAITPRPRPAMY
ncbi:hypothetical protein ACEN8K_43215, partial [Variovorax sp. CT11-76]